MRFFREINYSITLFFCLLCGGIVHGQQAKLKIIDQKTHEPVQYAHVCFESLKNGQQAHELTDEKGEVPNICTERSVAAITFVGYKTLFDTVSPGQSATLKLAPTAIDMDEVVVTAQYSPQPVDKSIYKVRVIGAKQIKQKAANNLADLFSDELSIRLTQDGALGSSMSIRGLSGENVKFLIDGVPVIGRLNGNIDLDQLNLNNVDHVELIEGPMSVIYGSNALAGVVNIITKENKNTKLQASFNSYYESSNQFNFNGAASIKEKRNVFSFSGGRNFFQGYTQTGGYRALDWKPKRQYTFDGYYIYGHPNYKLKLSSQYFNELLWNKGDIIEPHFAIDSYFTTQRFTNSIDFNSKIGKVRYLNITGAYSNYSRVKNTYFKDLSTLQKNLTTNEGDQDTTKFNDIIARAIISKSTDISKINYQFGLDVNIENGSGRKITDNHQEIGDYAAFLSLKYDPLSTFTIQPGFRYIYNTKYTAPLIYSLNVKWNMVENTNIRASYSRGFRSPSLKELYLYFFDVNHNIKGNENLKAEDSHNVDLSADYSKEIGKKTIGGSVDVFYNKINNIITLAQVTNKLYSYINIDNYISKGVQVSFDFSLYPHLKFKAGFVETGRKNVLDQEIKLAKSFFYTSDINSSIRYSLVKYAMDISLFYKYTGKMPQYFVDALGNLKEGYIKDYHTMDISVIKNLLNRSLQVSVGVKNLFNNKSIPAIGGGGGIHSGGDSALIGYGRTFFARVSYTFQKF